MERSIFTPGPELKVEYYNIGEEKEPLMKVESFVSGADDLKRYAIENSSFKPADNYYPGIRMPVPLIYTVALARNLRSHIQTLFGCDPRDVKRAVSRFSIVTRRPDELSLLQKIPHFDAATRKSLAAIHYLTNDEAAGTAMYRHRALGYEYIDAQRYDTYMQHVRSQFSDSAREPEGYICSSTNEYEMVASFGANYNRLILYRGSSLHSGIITPDYGFDPDPRTGRLTITSFFEFE